MIAGVSAATPVPPNFDRLARLYRWMEWASFGPFLGLCRRSFLTRMRACRRALVIGDGDGRFTARLLRENRSIRVDAVDASQAMLDCLTRRAGSHASRLRTCCIDARQWQPADGEYDLIVTHFFLDCLANEEVNQLAARVRKASVPGALWIVSEFEIPPGWWGRLVAAPVVSSLYLAFSWMTGLRVSALPGFRASLSDIGFHPTEKMTWLGGLLVAESFSLR